MIRLTKLTDYGIVLLSQLAVSSQEHHNAPELARETHLPLPMVSKILKLLARSGLLESHRGVKGGYRLSRSPAQISVAEIIGALEGPIAITECAPESSEECSYEAFCRVRANWQRINSVVREALGSVTLEEMAAPWRGARRPPAAPARQPLVHLGGP